ncbi:LuxR C-terminal-related transcriptional regulator [Lysobacter korlensis]|uniref:LuxR C-terminal-related transcriptional regulator n=1 Tax=Lysobacter korlensis TaxID=553636 RepID=A0ABV6S0S2_9GAMM
MSIGAETMPSHVTGTEPADAAAPKRRAKRGPLPQDILDPAPDWRELSLTEVDDARARILQQPDERWSSDPSALLALAASYRYTLSPNPFTALAYLDAADALLDDDDPAEAFVLSRLLRAGNARSLGRLEAALAGTGTAEEAARSARIALPVSIELQAAAIVESGICLTLLGRLDEARARLTHGMRLETSRWHPAGHVEGLGCYALLEFLLGHPAAARAAVARAGVHAGESVLAGHLSTAPYLVVAALIELEAGRVEKAESIVDAVWDAANGSEYEPLGHFVRASALASRARWHDALDALQDMQLGLRAWENPGLLRSLHDALRASVLITQGEGGPARQLITRLHEDEHHALCPQRLLARLEIAAGDFTAALEAIEPCIALGDDHAPLTHVYVDVLWAAAHDGLGDVHAAATAFDRALDAAARNDSRRPFASVPPERLRRLLAEARKRDLPEHSARLVEQLSLEVPAEQSGAEFVSPLSARERIVLNHIIAGHSARQISAQLRVSPNTIKTQVRSVYRKLGASNRHEAIERARSFGLTG